MGHLTSRTESLRVALLRYVPVCLAVLFLGMQLITKVTAKLLDNYLAVYPINGAQIRGDHVVWQSEGSEAVYWLLSNAEYALIPLWVICCAGVMCFWFYSRELRDPIEMLLDASRKIAGNDLDFHIGYHKKNEMGELCHAFEEMRQKLYDSNLEVWHAMEERKRLSAAFSHDLRTPLTVLSGYVELMQKYPLSPEKQTDILQKMSAQISRLRHYTEQMNAVQKLEDIALHPERVALAEICTLLRETGELLCEETAFSLHVPSDTEQMLTADTELIVRVYENLISNALRYRRSAVGVTVQMWDGLLSVTVCDDGNGFSGEALHNAARPFYRDGKSSDVHFGLGLYICRILCLKHGGSLRIGNQKTGGGAVTAEFFCKS